MKKSKIRLSWYAIRSDFPNPLRIGFPQTVVVCEKHLAEIQETVGAEIQYLGSGEECDVCTGAFDHSAPAMGETICRYWNEM